MTLQEFKTMLNAIINVGWYHMDVDNTDNLREKAKDDKAVAKFFNRCKLVSYHNHINLHDAVYHQLHRGNF